jgi:hypothetical protein
MSKVYVITEEITSYTSIDVRIIGVFSTKEQAQNRANDLNGRTSLNVYYDVQEYEMDKEYEWVWTKT